MNNTTIARNYSETLFALATKAKDLRGWGKMINDVAVAMQEDATLKLFFESPRIPASTKIEVLSKAFQDRMPRLMVRFLQSLVTHRRQMLIPDIARVYMDLVDEAEGRMHARVTVSREPSAADTKVIKQQLSRLFDKDVVPHMTVNESILGGVIVHVGDTVLDGSVRRRLLSLKRRMLAGR
jgi:F-type H+-transporting ATPase subunit delta